MPDSLRQPNLLCCGGTWIVPGDLLKTEDFSAIETLAREAAEIRDEMKINR
jgi:2-dehydro-3-deoxyphosphogluconate aldolase/(4S)-4-hydroxy-2-oxoglutarate aldolase